MPPLTAVLAGPLTPSRPHAASAPGAPMPVTGPHHTERQTAKGRRRSEASPAIRGHRISTYISTCSIFKRQMFFNSET